MSSACPFRMPAKQWSSAVELRLANAVAAKLAKLANLRLMQIMLHISTEQGKGVVSGGCHLTIIRVAQDVANISEWQAGE